MAQEFRQSSKSTEVFLGRQFDYVITICDHAREVCPVSPGAAAQLAWSFPDPALAEGSHDERLEVFRAVRDEIAARVGDFIARLG